MMWNNMMAQLKCCGVNSYEDFKLSDAWVKNSANRALPEACCVLSDKALFKPLYPECVSNPTNINSYYNTVSGILIDF